MSKSVLALALAGALAWCGAHAADAPAPGRYLEQGGSGTLTLKPNGEAEIATQGANGHQCDLTGRLVGWTVRSETDSGVCIVALERLPNGLRATPGGDADACRQFCGARAGLEGDYLIPPKGCADGERQATRRAFQALYDAKRYAEGRAKLAALMKRCDDQIGWLEKDRLLNDLALAEFHGGDRAACLRTLRPLAEDAAKSDDDLNEAYPPVDYESVLPSIKAARTNLKLCKGG